jgi:type IV secretion system protein VirD4
VAGQQDEPDLKGCIGTVLWFFQWLYIALVVEIKLLKWMWPFLKFTGLWAPLAVLWLDISLQKLGVPGDLWGLPFVGACGFCVVWTGKNLLAPKKKTKGEVPEGQGAAQPAAAVVAPRFSGVFFGTTSPPLDFWGKPKGKPEAVTKPITEDGHILVIGGAGSGKSSCVAIPTLRNYWDGRFLAIDIKGELAEKSERAAHIFNPMKPEALGYDPFYLVRESSNPVPDIRAIALALAPLSPENRDPFWIQAAQNILTGHLLFGFKSGASFIETIDVLQSVPPRKLLETEVKDEQVCRYLMAVVDLKQETLGSIMAQINNAVAVFATDTDVQAALTKQENITPELLERGENIFLQLPEYKLEQWKQLLSLIVQQFLTHFERRAEGNQAPILFMLDEFARIGKLETILHGLATLRSKKITICILTQSLAQLDAIYGREQRQIIADNCSYKAILRATDAETQEYFSKLVGTEEREKRTYSRGADYVGSPIRGPDGIGAMAWDLILRNQAASTSITTEEKRIIKPEDFAYLQEIVLLTPHGFQRVHKVPYYTTTTTKKRIEPALVASSRVQPPPPVEHSAADGRVPTRVGNWLAQAGERLAGVAVTLDPSLADAQGSGEQAGGSSTTTSTAAPTRKDTVPTAPAKAQALAQQQSREPHHGDAQKARPASEEEYRTYDLALEHACYPGVPGVPVQVQCVSFYTGLPPEERRAFRQYWEGQAHEKSDSPQQHNVCQMILQATQSAERSLSVVRLLTFGGQPAEARRCADDEERNYDLALEQACYPSVEGVPVQVQCASFYLALPPEERPAFVQYWERQAHARSNEPEKVKVCQMIREAAERAERSQTHRGPPLQEG